MVNTLDNSFALGAAAIAVAIAVFVMGGYFVFRNKKEPPIHSEIKTDQKDRVQRLSLFLAEKTKNPSGGDLKDFP